jgi:leucyl-tRNA synthetase
LSEEKSFTDRLTGIIRDARKHGPSLSGEGKWVGESIEVQIEDSVKQSDAKTTPVEETMVTETNLAPESTPVDKAAMAAEMALIEEKSSTPDSNIENISKVVTAKTSNADKATVSTDIADCNNDTTFEEHGKAKDDREELYRLAAILAVIRVASRGTDPSAQGRNRGTSFAQDHRRGMIGVSNLANARSGRSAWR